MRAEQPLAKWQGFGASVRGAAHERSGMPNQDAIGWLPDGRHSLPQILAVADGHGSPRCFRSEAGSALAVACGTRVLHDFLVDHSGDAPTEIARAANEALPQQLEQTWKDAVDAALDSAPFFAAELDRLDIDHGSQARAAVEANPYLAYGTTLLVVAVTDRFRIYAQLGDGDIVTVADDGTALRPLPPDERLLANETTSLCLPEAWRDVRVCVDDKTTVPPALIFAATDGYSNSFRDDSGFLQVGSDLLGYLRTRSIDAVAERLPVWLDETSRGGSGDDITVGILCRLDALECGSGAASR